MIEDLLPAACGIKKIHSATDASYGIPELRALRPRHNWSWKVQSLQTFNSAPQWQSEISTSQIVKIRKLEIILEYHPVKIVFMMGLITRKYP
jgi:hypothetical protein